MRRSYRKNIVLGVYDLVRLHWQFTLPGLQTTADPELVPVEHFEGESLVNYDLTPRACWQQLQSPASGGRPALERWACEVGKRRGDAWRPLTHATWLGNVLDYRRGEWHKEGFQERAAAQAWGLSVLAQLAGGFDEESLHK